MAIYKGTQASDLCEKAKHSLCTINEQPLQAGASAILGLNQSHLGFSKNGVNVALQNTPVVAVFDQ